MEPNQRCQYNFRQISQFNLTQKKEEWQLSQEVVMGGTIGCRSIADYFLFRCSRYLKLEYRFLDTKLVLASISTLKRYLPNEYRSQEMDSVFNIGLEILAEVLVTHQSKLINEEGGSFFRYLYCFQ